MKTYTIKVFAEDGVEMSTRTICVDESDLPAGAYTFKRRAEELYRDALFKDGFWDDYTIQRGAVKIV